MENLLETQGQEELLVDNPERWVLLPIRYDKIFEQFKALEESFWTPEDAPQLTDKTMLQNVSDEVSMKLKELSAFNAISYSKVYDMCGATLDVLTAIQSPEARAYLGFQLAFETFHQEVFAKIADALVEGTPNVEEFYRNLSKLEVVSAKARWFAENVVSNNAPFVAKMLAIAIVKQVWNTANSVMVGYFRTKEISVPGFTEAHRMLMSDIDHHVAFCSVIYNSMANKPPPGEVSRIVNSAVDVELSFAERFLPMDSLEITYDELRQQVQWRADQLLCVMNIQKIYNVAKPAKYAVNDHNSSVKHRDRASAKDQLDLMEKWRASQATKSSEASKKVFSLDEDF